AAQDSCPIGTYFPEPANWACIAPQQAGMDAGRLADAVAFSVAHETDWPRSLHLADGRFLGNAYVEDKPPYDQVLGPVRPRGGVNGMILRHGRIVAEWGDTARAD